MSDADSAPAEVAGERAAALIHRVRGIQSRFGSLIAVAVMLALGGGALSWYYVHLWRDRSAVPQARRLATAEAGRADPPLPPLGRIDPPPARMPAAPDGAPPSAVATMTRNAPEPAAPIAADAATAGYALQPAPAPSAPPGVGAKTPAERALERRLAGAAFTPASASGRSASAPAAAASGAAAAADQLSVLMQPTETVPVRARRLPSLRLLLPKGAFIDCTLETAIDSTLPGLTTCITATDTFGANGEVVLLERGTKLVGEVRGQVRQGMARVFVLWTEARTPDGVVVPLDSPGTDELGRAGLPGRVNRHFWQRFGAAMLVSIIDAGVQAGVQASNRGGGTLVVNPAGTENVMTEVLRSTVDIPPTIVKRQGDRIQVLVARDLDFRSVYALRVTAPSAHR